MQCLIRVPDRLRVSARVLSLEGFHNVDSGTLTFMGFDLKRVVEHGKPLVAKGVQVILVARSTAPAPCQLSCPRCPLYSLSDVGWWK